MIKNEKERLIWLGLAAAARLGQREINLLLRAVDGDLQEVLEQTEVLATRVGLAKGPRKRLSAINVLEAGQWVSELSVRCGATVLMNGDPAWPTCLDVLDNPPGALFTRGQLTEEGVASVALVGSRRCSHYGQRTARRLSEGLAEIGVIVVSGLARGIDRAAHEGTLDCKGVTWAVLGSGVDNVYPPESVRLADRIANERGCVLSEFSPDVGPRPHFFPRRNRIIAALADVTIVVEAASRSGALITARWAADAGKDVGVVPGPVDSSQSEGALALIRDGCTMVRGVDDICELLGFSGDGREGEMSARANATCLSGPRTALENRIVGALDHEPLSLDLVMIEAQGSAGEVLTALMSLENRGVVLQGPPMMFRVAM